MNIVNGYFFHASTEEEYLRMHEYYSKSESYKRSHTEVVPSLVTGILQMRDTLIRLESIVAGMVELSVKPDAEREPDVEMGVDTDSKVNVKGYRTKGPNITSDAFHHSKKRLDDTNVLLIGKRRCPCRCKCNIL